MTEAIYYDPWDWDIDMNPYPLWRRMREEAPVWYNEKHDFWVLTRYTDVMSAMADTERFSSAYGGVPPLHWDRLDTDPAQSMLVFQDRPHHDRLRRLVSKVFASKRIAAMEPAVREIAVEFLDRQVGNSEFDYVKDFAAKLPSRVFGDLLGFPREDHEWLNRLSEQFLSYDPLSVEESTQQSCIEAAMELYAYYADSIKERRGSPRDDTIGLLIDSEIVDDDGERTKLSDEELVYFIALLSGAGTETVDRHLGNVAVSLDQWPGERKKLVADPSKIPAATEEILRYEAPSAANGRHTLMDVTMHGVTIPEGSIVITVNGSAARDERVYRDPDVLNVDRDIKGLPTFGFGLHHCLGASLARLEGRVALEETLKRFPSWQVDTANTVRAHTLTGTRGWSQVPIAI